MSKGWWKLRTRTLHNPAMLKRNQTKQAKHRLTLDSSSCLMGQLKAHSARCLDLEQLRSPRFDQVAILVNQPLVAKSHHHGLGQAIRASARQLRFCGTSPSFKASESCRTFIFGTCHLSKLHN